MDIDFFTFKFTFFSSFCFRLHFFFSNLSFFLKTCLFFFTLLFALPKWIFFFPNFLFVSII